MRTKAWRTGGFLLLALFGYFAPVSAQSDPILFVGWPRGFYVFTPTTGAITTLRGVPGGSFQRMKILPGNRQILGLNDGPGYPNTFYVYDRDTGTMLPFTLPNPVYLPVEFSLDQDGDLLVTSNLNQGISLIDHLNFSTRLLFPRGFSEAIQDIDTGDYVFLDYPAFRLARGQRSGTVPPFSPPLGPGLRLYQDHATGEFLYWPNDFLNNPQVLLRVSSSGVVVSTMSLPWVQKEAMEVFSDPAPGREYLITRQYFADPFGWYTISRSSGETRLFQPFGTGPLPQTFIRDRARKLSTMSTGFGNQWNLYIDFADDPNRLYVCLLGSTGIRPGIPLADGRVIRLNVDALTWLGFSGQIPGLSGLVGRLDDRGTALGLLDLTWLPPGVSGIPFWLAGFTLDAAAPSGIRSVSDPIVIQLR